MATSDGRIGSRIGAALLALIALFALVVLAPQTVAQTPKPPGPQGPPNKPPEPPRPGHPTKPTDPGRENEGRRRPPPLDNPRNLVLASGRRIVFGVALDAELAAEPCVTMGGVVAGTVTGTLRLLEPSRGAIGWTARTGAAITGGPVVTADAVFVGTGNGQVLSFALRDGALKNRAVGQGAVIFPLATDGAQVAAATGNDELRVYQASDLTLRSTLAVSGGVGTAPLFAAGVLVVGTASGDVVGFDVSGIRARPLWRTTLRSAIVARPVLVPGQPARVLAGTRSGVLAALDLRSGVEAWRVSGRAAFVGASVVENRVYAAFTDNRIVELDAAAGTETRRVVLSSPPTIAPIVAADAVFAPLDSGAVAVLGLDLARRDQVDLFARASGGGVAGTDDAFIVVRAGAVYRFRP